MALKRYFWRAANLTEANPLPDNDHIRFILVLFPQPCKLNLTLLNGATLGAHSVFEPLSPLSVSMISTIAGSKTEHIQVTKKEKETQHKRHFSSFCFVFPGAYHIYTWPLIGAEFAALGILAVNNG